MIRIPFISVAINSWQFATSAFPGAPKKYLRKQQWKSLFYALLNLQFASTWFKILKSPDLSIVAQRLTRLYFKPFRVYMSIRWTKEQRIKVILDTYRFIANRGNVFLDAVTLNKRTEIAHFKISGTFDFFLILAYDYKFRKEGELVFNLVCDQLGGRIVAASFSFEEIRVGQWACRIGCVEGHPVNDHDYSKTAQKLMHGLRPKSFIVFSIQEFSRELGITEIYGVGDAIQSYRGKHLIHLPKKHSIKFEYDSLWTESYGELCPDGWYKLPITPIRKQIADIKTTKRALYHRRYELLDALSKEIAENVKKLSLTHSNQGDF